ncbi:hypothetical protein ACFL0H_05400 [Thermodesulfobacteriota bacterium]
MDNLALICNQGGTSGEDNFMASPYHSVELSIDGLSYLYQFKLWNESSEAMRVIVREGSEILSRLKVGKRFNMKYYSNDVSCTSRHLKTEILHITRADDGRFKGHYLVGLSIVENQNENMRH